MAIQLLGELKSTAAVREFALLLSEEDDFFEIRELALALWRIGTPQSGELIEALRHHPSRLVREYADVLVDGSRLGLDRSETDLGKSSSHRPAPALLCGSVYGKGRGHR